MFTITLDEFCNNAGNLFRCMWKSAAIMQAKLETTEGITEITKQKIFEYLQDVIKDCIHFEIATKVKYENGFPHDRYWNILVEFLEKYKANRYYIKDVLNQAGSNTYSSIFYWYQIGFNDDLRTLQTWAEQVRI